MRCLSDWSISIVIFSFRFCFLVKQLPLRFYWELKQATMIFWHSFLEFLIIFYSNLSSITIVLCIFLQLLCYFSKSSPFRSFYFLNSKSFSLILFSELSKAQLYSLKFIFYDRISPAKLTFLHIFIFNPHSILLKSHYQQKKVLI